MKYKLKENYNKKLLSMLAVSTLVGTSASNLKPLFTSNINQVFKPNQSNKNVNIHGENDNNPFITPLILNKKMVSSTIISLPNNVIYVGTKNENLWKSIDGINIEQLTNGIPNNLYIKSLTVAPNGTVYVGTLGNGLYKSNAEGNFEPVVNEIPIKSIIISLSVSSDGVIYVGILHYENKVMIIEFERTRKTKQRMRQKFDGLRNYCKNGYDILFLVPNESMKKFVDEQIKIYNWKLATFKTQILNFG